MQRDTPFLSALESLRKLALELDASAGLQVARLEWISWSYILERKEWVWSADDPLAWAAGEQEDLFLTRWVVEHMAPNAVHDLRREADRIGHFMLREYLQGRRVDNSIPANAVEWREWSRVLKALSPHVAKHTEYENAEEMRSAFRLWEETGYQDEG